MSNSNEIATLNQLLSDVKILAGSLSTLDKASLSKDQILFATAMDAISFRIRAVYKTTTTLGLDKPRTNPTNPTNPTSQMNQAALQIDEVLLELSKPNPDAKVLHVLLDDQLETLRKLALSEILTLSIE